MEGARAWGTVRELAKYPLRLVWLSAEARRRNEIQKEFARRHGIDTTGLISLSAQDVESPREIMAGVMRTSSGRAGWRAARPVYLLTTNIAYELTSLTGSVRAIAAERIDGAVCRAYMMG